MSLMEMFSISRRYAQIHTLYSQIGSQYCPMVVRQYNNRNLNNITLMSHEFWNEETVKTKGYQISGELDKENSNVNSYGYLNLDEKTKNKIKDCSLIKE